MSLKLSDSGRRAVPSLFRGSNSNSSSNNSSREGGERAPRLGYRSMVSVDDVPELFASIDSE